MLFFLRGLGGDRLRNAQESIFYSPCMACWFFADLLWAVKYAKYMGCNFVLLNGPYQEGQPKRHIEHCF